jgi:hypothetical protein
MRSNLHEARLADIDALPRVVRATTRREPKLGATARSFAILESELAEIFGEKFRNG